MLSYAHSSLNSSYIEADVTIDASDVSVAMLPVQRSVFLSSARIAADVIKRSNRALNLMSRCIEVV